MNFNPATISLASIDFSDRFYQITTNENLDDLCDSISAVGLLSSPLVVLHRDRYRIVAGFRRASACRRMKWTSVPVRILAEDLAQIDRIKIAIADNVSQRPLNPIELSRAIQLLKHELSDDLGLADIAKELGLPVNPALWRKVIDLRRLSDAIQQAILAERISLSMAQRLGELDEEIGRWLIDLFIDLKLGFNRQREVLNHLTEVARREDRSFGEWMGNADLRRLLDAKDQEPALRARRLLSWLQERRFPTVHRKSEDFNRTIQRLGMGPGIAVIPPRHFEGDLYTVTLKFSTADQLKKRWFALEKLIHAPEFMSYLE